VVVLLDLKMPKVNGVEVLREVKSSEKLKSIPVVMLTSSREARDLRRVLSAGGEWLRGQAGGREAFHAGDNEHRRLLGGDE
jgi:CheY-like chemotaxis protein